MEVYMNVSMFLSLHTYIYGSIYECKNVFKFAYIYIYICMYNYDYIPGCQQMRSIEARWASAITVWGV